MRVLLSTGGRLGSVFEYTDYRHYLVTRLGDGSRRTGLKSAAAHAMGCHTTYISQVLHGRADLSLEQADVLNRHFEHTKDESEFFLLLVSRARAGTDSLRHHFQERIDGILEQRLLIKNRIGMKSKISRELESKFYSSWLYGATHVLVSIPSLQTRDSLAEYLRVPLAQLTEILDLLQQVGLIEQVGDRYRHCSQSVHLGSDSVNISKHHLNWRIRSMQSIERPNTKSLHYSAAVSLSRKDAQAVKDIMIAQLKKNLDDIGKSKEEVAYGYCFDFFELAT